MVRTAREVWVSGRVQGVGFRWSTQSAAQAAGVHGWVRNLVDGRVQMWVEGEQDAIEHLLVWLRRGPGLARVDSLDVRPRDPLDYTEFTVRHGVGGALGNGWG